MSNLSYIVVARDAGWTLRHQGYDAGDFATQDEAVREAIDLAREASGCGHEARVLVQEHDGGQREAWRPGQDAA